MKKTLLSILAGFIAGAIFTFFNFPIPAPPTFEAFMGVFGTWLGFIIVRHFTSKRDA